MKCKFIAVVLFLQIGLLLNAQKKPLDHSVYDGWQSVTNKKVTNNGKFIGYSIDPQEGDSDLFIYTMQTGDQMKFARGNKLTFTSDSKFAVFGVKPFYKDIKAVKDKKLKSSKLTKDSLFIVNLQTSAVEKIDNVKSFFVPQKGGSVLVYQLEDPKDKKGDSKDDDEEKKDDDKPSSPLSLVVMNLLTGKKTTYENVIRYKLSENGKSLAFISQKPEDKDDKKEDKKDEKESDEKEKIKEKPKAKPKVTNKSLPVKYPLTSLYFADVESGNSEKLVEGESDFSQVAFDETGSQLAFVSTSSAKNDLVKEYQFNYYNPKSKKQTVLTNQNKKLPKDWVFSENRLPKFSKDGKQLYFGVAPKTIAKDTTLVTNDHAIVDIWSYKDDELQTIQLKNLKNDLKKSYLGRLKTSDVENITVLQDLETDTIRLVNEGNANFIIGSVSTGQKANSQWEGVTRKTYYIINNDTAEKTAVVANLNGGISISPLGKFAVYFDRDKGNWNVYDIANKTTKVLNQHLNVKFVNEEFDMPDQPSSYGIDSWTDNDESVIIKDRYDLWEFFLSGNKKPRNLTNGFGRANKISFATYDFDPDVKSLNRKSVVYLSAFNDTTKTNGFYKTSINSGANPTEVFMGSFWGARTLAKAKDADVYLYVKESYQQSPNLFVTTGFKNQKQLTDTNPQQKNYNWGTSELVHWITPKGYSSEGILYKPEDFDPNKKYPMIVYFYEKLSDGLNRYIAPAPTPSRLNISYFVSNGYLVFAPDISYENGQPGQSAVEYINSGVEYLKKNSWLDGSKIGIQGQSWGGYQVAYLITQNNMYAAAWAGAPVANMTSAYGGIRWSTGMNRQFQYEKSQSRIGKNLWEARDLYIENSPLFFFDKVNTPVAIMSNDRDGAVPWYQGIEMFTALKRLGKPAWLLNYNGDDHNLMKRQNRKDIQIREQQFFDYYLKGAKAPVWMTKGIPAVVKGKDWGFELTDDKP